MLLSASFVFSQAYSDSYIRFNGNTRISDAAIRLRLDEQDFRTAEAIEESITNIYLGSGFAFAKITSAKKGNDSLIVDIKEGPYCMLTNTAGFPDSLSFAYLEDLPKPYIAIELRSAIDAWLIAREENGRPLAAVEISSIGIGSDKADTAEIKIEFQISNTEKILINTIIISGADYTEEEIILRELEWTSNLPYTPLLREEMQESLYKLRIFESVSLPEIVENDSGKAVNINVVEGQTITFDGVVGYIPEQTSGSTTKEGYFTGLLDLNFANLFGTARKLAIHWQKPDAESDNFHIRYKEPWILGTPLNGIIGFERRVQDTLFLKQGINLEIEYPLSYQWDLYARFHRHSTQPDSLAAVERGITQNTHTQYITGIRYDSRDLPANPKKGMNWDLYFSYGNKDIEGPPYLLEQDSTLKRYQDTQILKFKGGAYQETFSNQVAALKIDAAYLNVHPGVPDDADLFWFGGAGSLRGYRENQFRSDKYAITSLEYRFLTGRKSRLFAFVDYAVFNFEDDTVERLGYGVGIRLQTGLGVLAIDYGLGEDDPFSQGKIHVGIVNEF